MVRERLIATVERMVGGLGYAFYSGSEPMLGVGVDSFPAVWLAPPRVVSVEGHGDCRVVYRITLWFMRLCSSPHLGNEALWQAMEDDAMSLYHTLTDDACVVDTADFKSVCQPKPLTKCGDAALRVEFDVETFYCR